LRWYLRYGLSNRDVEELLAERGIEIDHVTEYRWVQRFTPLLVDAARPCRHSVGGRWYVDETYVKVVGRWRYVCRAIDHYGQIIDVYVSPRRDGPAARRFFTTAMNAHGAPTEVVTDWAPTLLAAVDELMPGTFHNTAQYANNRIEADHARLKARLRPMRGLKRDHSARVIMRGHAFMQNLRRGHYELGIDARSHATPRPRSPNSPESSERQRPQPGLARPCWTQRNRAVCLPRESVRSAHRCDRTESQSRPPRPQARETVAATSDGDGIICEGAAAPHAERLATRAGEAIDHLTAQDS
jgi:transposase, IS6 family